MSHLYHQFKSPVVTMPINMKVFKAVSAYLIYQACSCLGACGSRCLRKMEKHGYECDKLKIALAVSRIWAYAGLYMAKSFEKVFQLILAVPDDLLAIPANCCSKPETSDGKKIQIISAFSEHGPITNKFKTFLNGFYEKKTADGIHKTSGFNFHNYAKLLNTSILWCNYILKNQNEINPKNFFKDVQQMMIAKHGDKVYHTTNGQLNDNQEPIFMGHITFDENEQKFVQDLISKFESNNSNNNNNNNINDDLSALIAELDVLEQ